MNGMAALLLLTATSGFAQEKPTDTTGAELKALIDQLATGDPDEAAAKLIDMGDRAVPSIIRYMDDRRSMKTQWLRLLNKFPGAVELFRHYSPKQVVDACAAILSDMTGEFGNFVDCNGGGPLFADEGAIAKERDAEVKWWRTWLKAQENLPLEKEKHLKEDLARLGVKAELRYHCVRDVALSNIGDRKFGDVVQVLKGLSRLENLTIKDAPLSDRVITAMQGLTNLKSVSLTNVPLSDEGLVHFKPLVRLEKVHIERTKVTEKAARTLMSALSKVEQIEYGRGYRDIWHKVPRKGHWNGINCLCFSRNGKFIASGGDDNAVIVWNADDAQEIRVLKGHEGSVCSVVFSPDGKWIASGSSDKTVRIWETGTGREVRKIMAGEFDIEGVSYSPDGKKLASVSRDGFIRIWDAENGQQVHLLDNRAGLCSVAYGPHGSKVAAGDDTGLRIWDLERKRSIHTPSKENGKATHITFSPDGQWIVGPGDGPVKVWNANTGEVARTLNVMKDSSYHSIEIRTGNDSWIKGTLWMSDFTRPVGIGFTPDGKRIVIADTNCLIQVWDLESGRKAMPACHGPSNRSFCMALSPDGRRLACDKQYPRRDIPGSSVNVTETVIAIWDLQTPK
jgi:WD40 repeat protein